MPEICYNCIDKLEYFLHVVADMAIQIAVQMMPKGDIMYETVL
jgi:hypothetical protein